MPLYTLLLPDNFAQPKVMAKSYPAKSTAVKIEPSPAPSTTTATSESESSAAEMSVVAEGSHLPTEVQAVEAAVESAVEDAAAPVVVADEAEAEDVVTLRDDLSEEAIEDLVSKNLIRVLSPGPATAPLSLDDVPAPTSAASTETISDQAGPSSVAGPSTSVTKEANLTWIPTSKEPVAHFVEAVGLTASELVGMTVYFPAQLGRYVPTAQLKRQKWTDASNKFDEEAGEDEMEWSDDEEEMLAKKRRKMA